MTVEVGTGGKGTAITKRKYPVDEGLEAGTTKQEGTTRHLRAQRGTNVPKRKRVGME